MYARSLKGSIAPKGQQNIAQGNVFLRHAQRPSLLGLCHAAENVGEANALGNRIPPQSFPEREADNCRNSNTSKN